MTDSFDLHRFVEARSTLAPSSVGAVEGNVTVHDCRVLDVSQNGAKVVTDMAAEVGIRIGLALVPHRPRLCEIVWRRGRTLGIKFVS